LKHINALKQSVEKQGKPSNLAIFNPFNIIYFSGFSEAVALLLTEQNKGILYVSTTNYEHAKAEVKNFTVEPIKRGEKLVDKIAKQTQDKKLAVDTLPIESWRALAKAVGGEEKLEPINNLIVELRIKKDEQEIKLIRQACKLADIGMQTAAEIIRPDMKEREVAAEVEYTMRKAGSDGTAFDTIVASGFCCAYPHGASHERTIEDGDFVVVDLGAKYKFYCSDITRTFIAGKPSEKQTKMFKTIQWAQQKAIDAIKPGVAAKDVDAIARRVVEEAGFCDYFVHNLGHGVGLEVHEVPVLSPDSKDVLEAGNVVTVEPGIYLPGFGGVRIEDTVLVTKSGAEKLTSANCSV
jgi:Xaa-Pro dipeptidase